MADYYFLQKLSPEIDRAVSSAVSRIYRLLTQICSVIGGVYGVIVLRCLSDERLYLLDIARYGVVTQPPALKIDNEVVQKLLRHGIGEDVTVEFGGKPVYVPEDRIINRGIMSGPAFSPSLKHIPCKVREVHPLKRPVLPEMVDIVPPGFSGPCGNRHLQCC